MVCVSVGNLAGYNHVLKVAQGTAEPVGSTLPNAVDSVIGGVVIDTWSKTADAVGVKLLLIDPVSKKIVYSTPVIQTDSVWWLVLTLSMMPTSVCDLTSLRRVKSISSHLWG